VADELGTAVLRLELDTSGLKEALAKAKQQVEQELGTATTATTGTSRTRRTPSGTGPADPDKAAAKAAAEEAKRKTALESLDRKRFQIARELSKLEERGLDVSRLRSRLENSRFSTLTLNNSLAEVKAASLVTTQLARQVALAKDRANQSAKAAAAQKREEAATKKATEASTATTQKAQKPTGVGFATTPEQILASRGGTQKGAAESLNAREAAVDKLLQTQNRINILEAKGLDVSRQRAALQQALTAANSEQLGTAKQITQNVSRQLTIDENSLKVANLKEAAEKRRQKAAASVSVDPAAQGPASPVRGSKTLPGSPIALQAEEKLQKARDKTATQTLRASQSEQKQQAQQAAARRKEIGSRVSGAIGSGLIGGGFPLLFGQGAGAAAGGAIGGIGGGAIGGQFGFALSVIGTTIGAAFDTALEKGKTLAAGLDDPIGQFDKLREAALFSSKATEKTVDALIAAGRAEEAKIIAENDLNARFGGAENAKEFADATDRLTRAWTEATVVMAGFVAGPLADFIQRLTNEAQIGPENVLAAQTQSQKFVESQFNPFERSLGVNKTVEFNNKQFTGDAASVYQQITEELIKQKRATDDITKAEAQRASTAVELEAAAKRNLDINKTNLALITAQAAGNRLEALNLRESLVQKEKTRAINLLPAGDTTVQRETIDLNAQKQLVGINAERLKVQQDIQKAAFTEFQAREQISSGIENTLQLLGTEQGQYRDTLGTIQQISATIDAARRKEAEIGFQIDQARIGGRDEEAARLVEQQRTAALETRKLLTESAFELQKAGESLKEASIAARDNLRGAVLEFTRTRSDEQGLNRFLSPQQQQNRAEQDLKTLLPSFREAQSRFTDLTGAPAPEFTGPSQDLNASVRDFIATVDREFQAGKDLGKAQQNLEQTSKALVAINTELVKATAALAAKEWLVSVNVVNNANGSSTVDAVNGLTS